MSAKKQKLLGQVFTPKKIVKYMCDMTKYDGDLTKTVFEPSFGDGAFLCEIYKRMIEWGRAHDMSDLETAEAIDKHLYGNEIDSFWYNKVFENLEKVNNQLSFTGTCQFPNITCGDTLELTEYYGLMDFVIGNPPYVKSSLLSDKVKDTISQFMFTEGSTDLYIIFYEFCMNCLKYDNEAHLIFITPRTYMNNESCNALRRYLICNNLIEDLVDYHEAKVFENADVYVSILHLNTHKKNTLMGYYNAQKDFTPTEPVEVVDLSTYDDTRAAEPWDFSMEDNSNEIQLGDMCNIFQGVDVPKLNLFVQKGYFASPEYVLFNGFMIENALLRPIVKGSTFDGFDTLCSILFPYVYDEEEKGYRRLTEEELKEQYPRTYRYLNYHRDILEKESNPDEWYGKLKISNDVFNKIDGEKRYTFKHIISPETERLVLTEIPDEIGIFSGFIISIKENLINAIKNIFESEEFLTYLRGTSRVMSGGYYVPRLTILKNYRACTFEEWKEIMNNG